LSTFGLWHRTPLHGTLNYVTRFQLSEKVNARHNDTLSSAIGGIVGIMTV
jgi:hypothetical protein